MRYAGRCVPFLAARSQPMAALRASPGLPGRARLVGRVLKTAPAGLKLPWHRVLGAGERIVFPSGTRALPSRSVDCAPKVSGSRVAG